MHSVASISGSCRATLSAGGLILRVIRRTPCTPVARRSPAAVARHSLGRLLPGALPSGRCSPKRIGNTTSCRSKEAEREAAGTGVVAGDGSSGAARWATTAAFGLLYAALLGYAFYLSPNQTPARDTIILEKLLGLKADEPYQVNAVFTALFNIMGIYPAIFAALIVPGGRSGNKVPAWPFISASFFAGAFGLIPYMVLWQPKKDQQLPPPPEELEGWNRLFMRGAETVVLPGILLALSVYWLGTAVAAGGDSWMGYAKLFDESRFVHVTTLDFCTLTALVPFWMSLDAEGRSWEGKGAVPLLSLLPLVGPALYLLLRPKTPPPPPPAEQ